MPGGGAQAEGDKVSVPGTAAQALGSLGGSFGPWGAPACPRLWCLLVLTQPWTDRERAVAPGPVCLVGGHWVALWSQRLGPLCLASWVCVTRPGVGLDWQGVHEQACPTPCRWFSVAEGSSW